MRSAALRAALAALLLPLTSCSAEDQRALTVFAAASLTVPFTELEEVFEAAHPEVDVQIAYGGSSDLVEQIRQGAPADVFASADSATMEQLAELAVGAEVFATNTLEIAVPPGNPAGVRALADLARPGLRLVTCAPVVPCGAASERLAAQAGLTFTPVSEEQSVTDVLGKVAAGEAEVGLVYRSDVLTAAGDVEGLPLPEAAGIVNRYEATVVTEAGEPVLAEEFVALLLSEKGQRVIADAGFGTP